MSLSKEAVEEFKQIYKKEFGEELGDCEAFEKASKLFNLMKILLRPKEEVLTNES